MQSPTTIRLYLVDVLVALACLAVGWGIATLVGAAPADDAWIVLRYVRNLLAGNGWCYEPGVALNASTSTANTLLIAGFGWVLDDLRSGQNVVFALGLGVAAFALYVMFRDANQRGFGALVPGLVAAVLCLTTPLFWSVFGLESPVLLGAAAGAWWAWSRSHFVFAAALCAVLTLTRPEGVLMPLAFLADRHLRHRDLEDLPWIKMAVVFGLPLGAWALFSWTEFGSLVPDSFAAKRAQAESGWWDRHLFFRGAKRSLALFDARQFQLGHKPFAVILGLVLVVTIACRHRALSLVGWICLVCVGYSILGVPYYHWYGTPLHLGMTVMLSVVFQAVWTTSARPAWAPRRRALTRTAALCAFALWVGLQTPRIHVIPASYQHYREAAAWIDAHATRQAKIGTAEIGVIGYGTWPRGIVDASGLVTRDVIPELAAGRLGAWFDMHQPEYIVMHVPSWKGLETMAEASPAFAQYREVFRSSDGRARVLTRVQ